MQNLHGQRKNIIFFPTFHPASIFYNRSLLELIYEDLEKLKQYVIKKLEKLKSFSSCVYVCNGFLFSSNVKPSPTTSCTSLTATNA